MIKPEHKKLMRVTRKLLREIEAFAKMKAALNPRGPVCLAVRSALDEIKKIEAQELSGLCRGCFINGRCVHVAKNTVRCEWYDKMYPVSAEQIKLKSGEASKGIRGDDIPASHRHDAGAYGRCSFCGRYSDNPQCLSLDFRCDCGKKNHFSGSFVSPDKNSLWCYNPGSLSNPFGEQGKPGGEGRE